MTACTNHGGKARRVVTAALVGVLSVGTVPMVALATGADTTDGIETMAAEWYTGAKVTKATDGKGKTLTGDLSKVTLEAGKGKYLAPTEISNGFTTTKVNTNDYVFVYSNDSGEAASSNGKGATGATLPTPADYFGRTTTGAGTYKLTIYKKNATGGIDTTQATDPIAFVLAKSEAAQGVKVDGTLTYKGTAYTADDFKFVDANGNEVKADDTNADGTPDIAFTSAKDGSPDTPQAAGDYYARFTDADGHSYSVPFSIGKLDLSKATLTVADQEMQPGDMNPVDTEGNLLGKLTVNDAPTSDFGVARFSVTKVVSPQSTGSLDSGAGEYTVTVSVAGDSNVVASSGTVTYSVLDENIFTSGNGELTYGHQDLLTSSTLDVYLVDGESFDASKVSAEYDGEKIAADGLEVSYAKEQSDGSYKACDAADLAEQGTYRVTVRVKPFSAFGSDDVLGGTAQFNVEVYGTKVDKETGIGFYVDGELAGNSKTVTFDGSDWLEKVTAVVKDEEGNTLTEGTDYELEVTLDGEEVTEAVDASSDAYMIKVVPLTFTLTGLTSDTLSLTIDPVTVTRLVADVDAMEYDVNESNGKIPTDNNDDDDAANDTAAGAEIDNKFYVKYTGSAVEVPAVKYQVQSGSSYSYVTLDPSLYNVVSIEKGGKVVEEAVEEGTYTVTIALSDEAKSNYSLGTTGDTFEFTIKEYGHFVDVNPEAWYAQAVENAWYWKYVNGVGGTDVFMPETQITRADAVGIIYNMAGGTAFDDFHFDETGGYVTGFSDVDGHAYYARAIAWANAAGVVNGHAGAFNPDAKITRQEFAAMLANYAKATGKFVAPSADALDGISDAASVDAWATESVSWAVENGVMGNAGSVWAGNTITRAEVAAMAVNYQPESLDGTHRTI